MARVPPTIKRSHTESEEQQVGQDGVREFDKHNELPQIKAEQPGKENSKWAEDMAFMNEEVIVVVHEATDKNADPFPAVWVNGRVQRFVRGEEQKVRRCFVERLARSKLTTFNNVKTKGVDGEDKFVYPSHTGLLYPFAVINDSDKGKQWLKRVLQEQ